MDEFDFVNEKPRFIEAKNIGSIYKDSIFEQETGEIDGDAFGNEWCEIIAVIPDDYHHCGNVGPIPFPGMVPVVFPRAFAVILGDCEGNALCLIGDQSPEDAIDYAKDYLNK